MLQSEYTKSAGNRTFLRFTCLKFGSIYWVDEKAIDIVTPSVTSKDKDDFKARIVDENLWVGSLIMTKSKEQLFVKQPPDTVFKMMSGQGLNDGEYEAVVEAPRIVATV